MVTQVSPDKIDAYSALLSGVHPQMVAASISEGNTAAQLWEVTQPDGQLAVLLWDKGNNVFYLAGTLTSAQDELAALLRSSIRQQAIHEQLTYFKARALSPSFEAALPALFGDTALRELSTLCYGFTGAPPPVIAPPPIAGLQLAPIDRDLLAREDLANLEPVRSEIRWMWPSEERFYEQGFGSAALVGQRVICWCTAEYRSATRCGIGIETEPDYQRRGVATATAAHFVVACIARGITPYWESRSTNLPSIRVAEKIGFERLAEERSWAGSFEE